MGELAAKHLHRSGAKRIFVTNRTWERALEMAELFQGKAIEYSQFPSMLHEMDIVIASSGAPHYILSRDEMQRAIATRRNTPMYLIDLAVPRNIDPSVNDVEGVFLYDVDDLEGVVTANIQERSKQADQAEAIVLHEVDRMMSHLRLDVVTPTIVGIQEQLENIRVEAVTRALRRMPAMPPEQQQQVAALIDAATKSMINKIAHGPISVLRRSAAEPDGDHFIDTIRKAFHLQD